MSDARLRVLVVCTANICRSPVTAMMLDRELLARGINAVVESGGFLQPGEPACASMASFAAEEGLDLSFHESRPVDEWRVRSASVILTMERRHARDLIVDLHAPPSLVHTIGGFLNLAESLPPHGESLEEWLIRVGGSRPVASLLAENTHEEISDPHGQSRRAHRKTFDRLESTSRDVADVLSAMSAVHRP